MFVRRQLSRARRHRLSHHRFYEIECFEDRHHVFSMSVPELTPAIDTSHPWASSITIFRVEVSPLSRWESAWSPRNLRSVVRSHGKSPLLATCMRPMYLCSAERRVCERLCKRTIGTRRNAGCARERNRRTRMVLKMDGGVRQTNVRR